MRISKDKLVYPELSYNVLGAAFSAFNELGWGLSEKDYQRGLAKELGKRGKGKIILELKVVPKLGYVHTRQLLGYLIGSGYKLGILLYFTKDGVKHRRVLNSSYFAQFA